MVKLQQLDDLVEVLVSFSLLHDLLDFHIIYNQLLASQNNKLLTIG